MNYQSTQPTARKGKTDLLLKDFDKDFTMALEGWSPVAAVIWVGMYHRITVCFEGKGTFKDYLV